MNTKTIIAVALVALIGAAGYAFKQTAVSADMPKMDHSAMVMADGMDSTKGYQTVMAEMMKGMMQPMTGKPELDFVQGMLPHHQGAIDMAKVVLKFGKDPEIKNLAENVIKAQEGEIAVMKDWLAKSSPAAFAPVPDSAKANEQAMSTMMQNISATYSGDADVDFVNGMIPHHQGAIDMAKVAQQYVKDTLLLKLAGDVVGAQEGEITFMKEWLKKNGH